MTEGETLGPDFTPVKEGFTFGGWTTDANGKSIAQWSSDTPVEPEKPTFGEPLEDSNGLTLNGGGAKLDDADNTDFGKMLNLPKHKRSGAGHANITNVSVFQSGAFTVILGVRPIQDNTNEYAVKHTALSIGNGTSTLRLLTATGEFGYGGDVSGNGGETPAANRRTIVSNMEMEKWYSVAMTYEEKGSGNGSVVIYVNGNKAGEVTDVGFKLSTLDNLAVMLGCGRNTAFIMAGLYDGVQVAAGVMDGETLCQMTSDRYAAKKPAPEVTKNYCGKSPNEHDVWWEFDTATGTLTISGEGTGVMADYTNHYPLTGSGSDTTPWKEYKNEIKKLVVTDGDICSK